MIDPLRAPAGFFCRGPYSLDEAVAAPHIDDMTDTVDIAAIEERAAAATRGPWRWTPYDVPDLVGRAGDPDTYEYDIEVIEATHDHGCGCRRDCTMEFTIRPQDAEFIAHARTDIDALIVEVKRLRDEAVTREAGLNHVRLMLADERADNEALRAQVADLDRHKAFAADVVAIVERNGFPAFDDQYELADLVSNFKEARRD